MKVVADDVWGLWNVIEVNYKGKNTLIIKEIYEVEIRGRKEENNKEVEKEGRRRMGGEHHIRVGWRVFVDGVCECSMNGIFL